jgi:hypothetical protein
LAGRAGSGEGRQGIGIRTAAATLPLSLVLTLTLSLALPLSLPLTLSLPLAFTLPLSLTLLALIRCHLLPCLGDRLAAALELGEGALQGSLRVQVSLGLGEGLPGLLGRLLGGLRVARCGCLGERSQCLGQGCVPGLGGARCHLGQRLG